MSGIIDSCELRTCPIGGVPLHKGLLAALAGPGDAADAAVPLDAAVVVDEEDEEDDADAVDDDDDLSLERRNPLILMLSLLRILWGMP
jgi:hypothetical protein